MKKLLLASLALVLLPIAMATADAKMGVVVPVAAIPANLPKPADEPKFTYLNPADYQPNLVFAPPPKRGSKQEAQELAHLRVLIAEASPERLAQAKWDGDTEDPRLYNAVLGRDLTKLPATWALLIEVQNEADAAIDIGKVFFARARPYAIDLDLPTCKKRDPAKLPRSYPSGHSAVGYSVGWALAKLLPALAPQILARGQDYALSRELCGNHFHSDTEASHVIATMIAEKLLADPRMADKLAAAKAELAAAR